MACDRMAFSLVPFTNRIDFVHFDFWHYGGRTSKHGAFMLHLPRRAGKLDAGEVGSVALFLREKALPGED